MTQLTALKELAAKVEAGDFCATSAGFAFPDDQNDYGESVNIDLMAYKSFHGSLDAANALHDAVLPGWEWAFYYDGECGVQAPAPSHKFATASASNPARAWLLAIIRAKISELEAGQ